MSAKNDKFVSKLDEAKPDDLVIAHWANFAPLQSGLYETCKELCQFENRTPGVIAGIVEPDNKTGGNVDTSVDPNVVTQSHDWAYRDANIHMVHSSLRGISHRLEPMIFFIHGSPEACLWDQLDFYDRGFSMTSVLNFIERSDAVITFMKRHKWFWDHYDKTGKIFRVDKGVDLERFKPQGMKMKLEGEPKILYGEVWRQIKDPFVTFFAMDEYWKMNQKMKFHPWALSDKRRLWENIIAQAGFQKFLGQYLMSGPQKYPEHWYRGGDILISPVMMGEPSRVTKEALACGCPVISWDADNFDDTGSFKKAKAFDPRDMAQKCVELWEEIQENPRKIRRRARRIAERRYSGKRMAEQVVSIAREVFRKKSS